VALKKLGPQNWLANNEQSKQEAIDRAAAVKAGQYARTARKHTGVPIANPKPVILPNKITDLANKDRAQLLAQTRRPPSPPVPGAAAATKVGPEQLELPMKNSSSTNQSSPISSQPSNLGSSVAGTANKIAKTTVPFLEETEQSVISLSNSATKLGLPLVSAVLAATAKALPIAGAGAVFGTLSGQQYEEAARSLGASPIGAKKAGAYGALLTGLTIGAASGALAGGIGAAPGALLGGLFAVAGYTLFGH